MFASSRLTRVQRRGVILVVVLGMLGLLALIGVTFATFSNQAQINARNFSQSKNSPDASEMMDFALSQLISDTANPASVLRGHSLSRDMYGSDASTNGALLNGFPDGSGPMMVTAVTTGASIPGTLDLTTNIPQGLPYGYQFKGWTLKFPAAPKYLYLSLGASASNLTFVVSESHEVLFETVNAGYRVFTIKTPYIPNFVPISSTTAPASGIHYKNVTGIDNYVFDYTTSPVILGQSVLPSSAPFDSTKEPNGHPLGIPINTGFLLDARYLKAFNGPGIGTLAEVLPGGTGLSPRSMAEFANFRYNGNLLLNSLIVPFSGASSGLAPLTGNPDFQGDYDTVSGNPYHYAMPGMDEDYDACDLENWFLAIQTADGQVAIPSFHRPGILSRNPDSTLAAIDNDWTRSWYNLPPSPTGDQQVKALRAMSRILRPRRIDGHSPVSFPDLLPDTNGKITYDVDNDGDGTTDSVWLDLGFKPRRDPQGKLYKPLYSFMVIGLNGKLPLNTAGNLADRTNKDVPVNDHADHLGNSPSEIDIRYALQNAYSPQVDSGNVPLNPFVWNTASMNTPVNHPYTQVDNAGVNAVGDNPVPVSMTQSRNILAGMRLADPILSGDLNQVMVNGFPYVLPNNIGDFVDNSYANPGGPNLVNVVSNPVSGRWAEENNIPTVIPRLPTGTPTPSPRNPHLYPYTNPVRAGNSSFYSALDARDDNNNAYDPFYGVVGGSAESADKYDLAGGLVLPVERIRRFVTPHDMTGDGEIVTFNPGAGANRNRPTPLGADPFGRVHFFHYFRPPGLPLATFATGDPVPAHPNSSAAYTHSPLWINTASPYHDARTNNLYHGYVSNLAPSALTAGRFITSTLAVAGMPSDVPAYVGGPPATIGTITTTAATAPTFTYVANSNPIFPSPGINEADEMDHYTAGRLDKPFGPADLEWLYRAQDVDGPSLQSRLAQLAPVSFTNPADGFRRRRLFALDSWELTNYVYANDNPSGAFPANSRWPRLAFPPQSLNLATRNPKPSSPSLDWIDYLPTTPNVTGSSNPSVAHKDKRINLNFPLPVSNSPIEPIRQKWIRETYTLLKNILPPKATDTPEELAQLSQFIVNIIDYRDPDCTITKFVNTDLAVVPATAATTTTPSTPTALEYAVSPTAPRAPILPASGLPYDSTIVPSGSAVPSPATDGSTYLIQYGMEYQPVAINEVLAFNAYVKKTSTPAPVATNYVPRMFVELVNTLNKDALATTSDLDLTGWDFVIMGDNGLGRPDPITGQIPIQPGVSAVWLNGTTASTTTPTSGANPAIQALVSGATIPGTGEGSNYYYVFGNSEPAVTDGTPLSPVITPASTNKIDLLIASLTTDNYYWLYLRRPLNPFDPTYDPANPNDNRVVVDCFRFLYTKSNGSGYTDGTGDHGTIATGDALFSLQRMQPYRGGHAVPPLTAIASAPNFVIPAYGYTEQTSVGASTAGSTVYYGAEAPSKATTKPIPHTLGNANNPRDAAWDYPVFNDRDFTSVVELLNVPSCSPGLFTKQFCEVAPPIFDASTAVPGSVATQAGVAISPTTWSGTTPKPPWYNAGTVAVTPTQFTGSSVPHVFPYMNDEFFYTASNENSTVANPLWWPEMAGGATPPPFRSLSTATTSPVFPGNYIGGPGGAGWHKMLDFFEVPSSAINAYDRVQYGANYDWARKDLRPGLLNINLIVDEEVFLGLMGDWLYGGVNDPIGPGYNAGFVNSVQIGPDQTPSVVTQVDDNGSPIILNASGVDPGTTAFNMPNVGIADTYLDPTTTPPTLRFGNGMKAVFSDFLKLRHGGSGYVFGYGSGSVGQVGTAIVSGTTVTTPIAAERPYRSLSYPDIDYTILRPATLPPSYNSTPVFVDDASMNPLNHPNFLTGAFPAFGPRDPNLGYVPRDMTLPLTNPRAWVYTQDPGVKSPYLFTQTNPVQPPTIPPRRLFQVADWWGYQNGQYGPPAPGVPPATLRPSNASSSYNSSNNGLASPSPWGTGDPGVTNQVLDPRLSTQRTDLSSPYLGPLPPSVFFGAPQASPAIDQRDHPYFRTEWLQRMANLTTVRTHQYAVWITVGLFEVTREGDPLLANSNPALAYDILGLEVGALGGTSTRYRGFYLIDRTRAVGFNPSSPDDFRNCVVYRQLIE